MGDLFGTFSEPASLSSGDPYKKPKGERMLLLSSKVLFHFLSSPAQHCGLNLHIKY